MDANDVHTAVVSGRQALSEAIAQVPPERMSEPGLAGGWSVKDVIAHVAWWDLRMCRRVGPPAGLDVNAPEAWPAESSETDAAGWADDINQQVRSHYALTPLDEVRNLYEAAGAAVVSILDGLRAEHFAPGSPLAQGLGRPVLEAIAVDTFEHYPEHEQAIRLLLERGRS